MPSAPHPFNWAAPITSGAAIFWRQTMSWQEAIVEAAKQLHDASVESAWIYSTWNNVAVASALIALFTIPPGLFALVYQLGKRKGWWD